MIKNFRHKGIQVFFESGSKSGIQAQHERRLRLQLSRLDDAKAARDMDASGWKLHPLKGDLKNHWAVWVDAHWRLTFTFEGEDAILVDYQDYLSLRRSTWPACSTPPTRAKCSGSFCPRT